MPRRRRPARSAHRLGHDLVVDPGRALGAARGGGGAETCRRPGCAASRSTSAAASASKGHVYPEDLLIPFLARRLGRPVQWIEDRREHLLCSCHSRDQIHDVEVGFDDDGRILALRDRFIVDCGAWNPIGAGVVYNTAVHLPGPYKIDAIAIDARIAATNKAPNAPYRGAGRPEAAFAMERIIDLVAGELGLEPAEVRLRNMIRADEMPYAMGIPYRDGQPIVYDGGDYPAALEKALAALGGLAAFRERQRAARQTTAAISGSASAVMSRAPASGRSRARLVRIDPVRAKSTYRPAPVRKDRAWRRSLRRSSPTPGSVRSRRRGHLARRYGGHRHRLRHHRQPHHRHLVGGHSWREREGCARKCSPSPPTYWNARRAISNCATAASASSAFRAPNCRSPKSRRRRGPGWDHGRPPGVDAGLEETYYFEPPTVTWSYAVHAAVVEVDVETGRVKIENYAIAHDCGVVVNPMLVEGQIVGGAVQGIGGALLEEIDYDADGPAAHRRRLMDTCCRPPASCRAMHLIHQHSPSPLNPLGVKGVGEGGPIAPPAAIANAVCDALSTFKAEFNQTPIAPHHIVEAVRGASPA